MNMSEEGDTYWISLAEKFLGILLIIIGAIMIYFTATSALGSVALLFGFLAVVLLVLGVFLLLVKAPE
jgi:hypothetical protein